MNPFFSPSFRRFSLLLAMTALFMACIPQLRAQYFTETFDDIPSLWTNGWAQQNRSANPGADPNWVMGDPGIFSAYNGGDTSFIGVSYNCQSGSGTISNWLFMPTTTFVNGEKISFWTRTVNTPNYPDRMQVRLSLNGASTDVGTSATSVGDFTTLLLTVNPNLTTTGYPNHWTEYTVVITGLSAPTSGRIAFRYFVVNGGSAGANSEYIGLDSVAYYLPPAGDLKMQSIQKGEYTIIAERQQNPMPFIGKFENYGSTTVTNATLQVNVFNAQGALAYTGSSTPHPSLAPGAIVDDTVAAAPMLAPDSYTVQYIARHSAADADHSNDTLYDHFVISPYTYGRDNGEVVGSIGIGALVGGYVGQQFHLYQPDNVDSVWVQVTKGFTGRRIAAVIWDKLNGAPNQIVGATDTLIYATDSAASYTLPMHGGPLQLAAGDFVVTMVEFDSTLHIALGAEVFTDSTVWLSWPTLPLVDWRNVEYFHQPIYNHAQMIRPILAVCDLTVAVTNSGVSNAGAQDGTLTAVPAGGTPPYAYTWSTGATSATISSLGVGSYSLTVTDGGGCVSVRNVDLAVGLESGLGAFECGVFPNPNDGHFRVFVRGVAASDVTLRVVDLVGRVVLEERVADAVDFVRDVDLSGVGGGIYCVEFRINGTKQVVKILVD